MKKLLLCVLVCLLFVPIASFADTYYGGFEDRVNGDYDYNDLVFTISGNGLTLHTLTGQYFMESSASLNNSGNPFWNHLSGDSPSGTYNVGYCIYGGGGLGCEAGLNPTALYLATLGGGAVNDVYFTASGSVTDSITIKVSADSGDTLGYQDSNGTHWFPTGITTQTFTPVGSFDLIGENSLGQVFNSAQSNFGDGTDHFAFFTPVPEPASLLMFGSGILGLLGVARRKLFNI